MAELEDRRRGSPSGEEELRFIRNFHDIFLSIGLAMFAAGLGIVTALLIPKVTGGIDSENWRQTLWVSAGFSAADALVMWMLGEVFARTRRLFLPSIVILVWFLIFVSGAIGSAYIAMFSDQSYKEWEDAMGHLKAMPLTVFGVTTFATLLFYLRTKLPFSMGVLGVGLAATGVGALIYQDPQKVIEHVTWLILLSGVFLFVLGVFFDARDPARKTRISDNGFWLHFFAAPLIFSATMELATGSRGFRGGAFDAGSATTTLIIVIVFALVSLLINRRALLVSGLLSAAIAIGVLVKNTGLDGAWTAALTLLLLGGAMVLLGGGWHSVRRVLVAPFPKTGLIARIIQSPRAAARGGAPDSGE
ncbi:MAG: hypothetical protein R3C58_05955 [Parvularculaceae bacterium]